MAERPTPDEIVECIKSSIKALDVEQVKRLIKLTLEAKEKKMSAREKVFSQKRYLSPNCQLEGVETC